MAEQQKLDDMGSLSLVPRDWPTSAVVIGASRGLGWEFTRQLSSQPETLVFAGRRDSRKPVRVQLAGNIVHLVADYACPSSLLEAAAAVEGITDSLDLLINCGALNRIPGKPPESTKGPISELDAQDLIAMLLTNTVGPLMAVKSFWRLLSSCQNSMVVNVTTSRARFSLQPQAGSVGYTVSKAALNFLTLKIAAEAGSEGPRVIALDPGWVRTDMGGLDAPLTAEQSVTESLNTLKLLPTNVSGVLVSRTGEYLPW